MENNVNVLMAVCNTFNPDSRVFRAADTIQSIGHSVKLLSYWREGLSENEILGTGFSLTRIKTRAFFRYFPRFSNWQKGFFFRIKAKKYADKIKPGIVHCHDYYTLFLGIYCKKKFKSKVIYDCHEYFQDMKYLHRYPLFVRKRIAFLERQAIKKYIDEMVVVSPGISELYKKYSKRNIHIIRNIPDFSKISHNAVLPGDVKNYLEEQKKAKRKLLLYLGNNAQTGRGMDFAFRLLKELPEEFGMVSFGGLSKNEVAFLTQKSNQYKITERYQAFSSLSVAQLLNVAGYCYMGLSLIEPIYISYYHALPNKFFEYIMMGLPVISSDIPDQKELILKYDIGTVVPFDVKSAKQILLNYKIDYLKIDRAKSELSWLKESYKYKLLGY